jgi:hypothetical protein
MNLNVGRGDIKESKTNLPPQPLCFQTYKSKIGLWVWG